MKKTPLSPLNHAVGLDFAGINKFWYIKHSGMHACFCMPFICHILLHWLPKFGFIIFINALIDTFAKTLHLNNKTVIFYLQTKVGDEHMCMSICALAGVWLCLKLNQCLCVCVYVHVRTCTCMCVLHERESERETNSSTADSLYLGSFCKLKNNRL